MVSCCLPDCHYSSWPDSIHYDHEDLPESLPIDWERVSLGVVAAVVVVEVVAEVDHDVAVVAVGEWLVARYSSMSGIAEWDSHCCHYSHTDRDAFGPVVVAAVAVGIGLAIVGGDLVGAVGAVVAVKK